MNRIKILFLILFVILLVSGCSEEGYIIKKINKQEVVLADNIWCASDNFIIYSNYEEDSLAFYSYDYEKNSINKLGEVINPYIYSGDLVIIRDDIFFYCNEVTMDESAEEKLIHTLYNVNINKSSLNKIISDDSEQTLIYIEALDDKIISLKGKEEGHQAITYLDSVDITKGVYQNFDFLLKQYDSHESKGEVIYNFSSYDSDLYVLIKELTEDSFEWKIEKYNVNGKCMETYVLNDKISKCIEENRVSKFEVLGEYGFIRTFSGNGVLFDFTSSEQEIVFDAMDLDIAYYKNNTYISERMVLYSRDTLEVWILDIENKIISTVDQNISFKCILMSDENQMIVWGQDISYIDLDSLPLKNEKILIE